MRLTRVQGRGEDQDQGAGTGVGEDHVHVALTESLSGVGTKKGNVQGAEPGTDDKAN